MEYEDRVTIATPEGVELQLTLAGIGSRMIAALIDLTIQGGLYLVLALALAAGSPDAGFGVALFAVAGFLIVFAYDVAFEVLAAGRTPGKRLAGLRVVRSGGRPVDFVTSAIRNVLRIIDVLPGLYAVGMISVLATRRNQRLGDLAAGTLVVRERLGGRARPAGPAPFLPPAAGAVAWDVSGVGSGDIATVRSFLARRAELDPAAAERLAADLAARLRPMVAGAPQNLPPEQFLEQLAAAKAARG